MTAIARAPLASHVVGAIGLVFLGPASCGGDSIDASASSLGAGATSGPDCGDAVCSYGETCAACPADCGVCVPAERAALPEAAAATYRIRPAVEPRRNRPPSRVRG
jgi:hypothetical protein